MVDKNFGDNNNHHKNNAQDDYSDNYLPLPYYGTKTVYIGKALLKFDASYLITFLSEK